MTEDTNRTYDLELLRSSFLAWECNKSLRILYKSLFQEMADHCSGSDVLEVGSGIAVSRCVFKQLVTTDIEKTEYVDRAMSAYEITPMDNGQPWSDIIAMDVLHHLQEPLCFLASASKMLRHGGRIILMEPAGTFGGTLFYRIFHHEPIRVREIIPPYVYDEYNHGEGFANMGMAQGLFAVYREWTEEWLQENGMRLDVVEYRDLLAYPLTGGYSKPALMPEAVIKGLLKLEASLPQWLLSFVGLRMCVVMTKTES